MCAEGVGIYVYISVGRELESIIMEGELEQKDQVETGRQETAKTRNMGRDS